MDGDVVVQDGGKHLDALGVAGVEEVHVEAQSLLVGRLVVAVGVDAGPADGGAQHLDPQLGEEVQILPPAVVEVDAPAEGVVLQIAGGQGRVKLFAVHAAVLLQGPLLFAPGRVKVAQILGIQPLAALVVGALGLGGRHGAAPQKILRETGSHHKYLLKLITALFW